MTDAHSEGTSNRFPALQHLKKGLQALCLITMVAAFVSLGTFGYQGWKLFHNPYRVPARRLQAPSPEAADWAAEVYRLEKRDHLLVTGIIEVAFIIVSAGSWFAYRKLDRRLQQYDRDRTAAPQRNRSKGVGSVPET